MKYNQEMVIHSYYLLHCQQAPHRKGIVFMWCSNSFTDPTFSITSLIDLFLTCVSFIHYCSFYLFLSVLHFNSKLDFALSTNQIGFSSKTLPHLTSKCQYWHQCTAHNCCFV